MIAAGRAVDDRRRADAEREQHDGDEPPRARRGQPRQQAEAARERSGDRADGVRRVREADLSCRRDRGRGRTAR